MADSSDDRLCREAVVVASGRLKFPLQRSLNWKEQEL